ncbi:MAG: penicillin-binding transpeptidase domain-containing protein, partial [Eubacteriales bacterium]
EKTVQQGTATAAQMDDYKIAGKTGTAEFVEDGQTKNHSWFVGFVDNAKHPLAICVILEGAGFGSSHATPLARDVLSYAIGQGY